jgi:hypothetical protein
MRRYLKMSAIYTGNERSERKERKKAERKKRKR